MKDSDLAIVTTVLGGDREAFRRLVDRHKSRLYGVLCKMLGDAQLAEELAQDAFVRAYQSLDRYRGEAEFSTWLVQIGVNAARDHLRRQQRLRRQKIVSLEELSRSGSHADPPDRRPDADPALGIAAAEESDIIRSALDRLPCDYRTVLILKNIEGWPYERISELTGDSIGTLKVRAHRARKLMKEQLSRLGWPTGHAIRRRSPATVAEDEESSHA